MNCFPQTLQTNSPTILMKYVAFLFLLGRPADTDWPVITVGFDFEKPRNNSQNGSKYPPHATHFFWPKIHGVRGGGLLTVEWAKIAYPGLYFHIMPILILSFDRHQNNTRASATSVHFPCIFIQSLFISEIIICWRVFMFRPLRFEKLL